MNDTHILFIRRNDYVTMLDHSTWVKTVEKINHTQGFSSQVIFTTTEKISNPKYVDLIYIPTKIKYGFYILYLIKIFFKLLRIKNKKDTVLFIDIFTYPVARLISLVFKFKTVYLDYRTFYFNYDDSDISGKDRFFKALTINSFKFVSKNINYRFSIIVDEMKDFINRYVDTHHSDYLVWSSAVNPSDFQPNFTNANKIKEKLSLNQSTTVFLYHGHITENRGLATIIKSFNAISCDLDILLIIIGDGPAKEQVQSLLKDNMSNNKIVFLGRKDYDEISDYISICDVGLVCYPIVEYWSYNNPIKLSEYMLLNKHVMISNIKPFVSMASNGSCSIVNEFTIDKVCDAIIDITNNIQSIRLNATSDNSKKFIIENYTFERIAEKIIEDLKVQIEDSTHNK